MAKRHVVKCTESFVHEYELGALVVDGKELRPAEKRSTKYEKDTELLFQTKAHATEFAKYHSPRMLYVGVKQV